jgi:hypothetical protein
VRETPPSFRLGDRKEGITFLTHGGAYRTRRYKMNVGRLLNDQFENYKYKGGSGDNAQCRKR